jgi:sortase A
VTATTETAEPDEREGLHDAGPELLTDSTGAGDPWRPPPGPTRKPPKPEPAGVWVAVRALLAFSLLSLWVLFYAFVFSGVQEGRNQSVLYAQLREQLADATAPLGGAIEPGSPVFLMDAPAAGLHQVVVVEGTTSADLTNGPGHFASSVLPGQPGTSVVFGRSVTYGAPFQHVSAMKPGQLLTVTTGQGVFTYRVDDVRYPGDQLPAAPGQGQSRLTMVTSTASGWQAGWAPRQTVYVDATMTAGGIQQAPNEATYALSRADLPMKGDPSALVPLVLWLQGLLIVAVLAVAGRARWGRWQTWLVAAPMGFACLWGATQAGMMLLPNLI